MKLPPYDKFPQVSNNKVLLRQIGYSEVGAIIGISFYDSIQAKTLQEAIEMQVKIEEDYKSGNSIHWGIAGRSTNELVGTCGYYRGFDKGEGELGCVLLPQFRGQGYMTSALLLAIEFGLAEISLNRIKAITTKQNVKAIKLIEKLNFIKVVDLNGDEIGFELTMRK
jgi:ribosomal-protein-alanine N-acetyltransferase